MALAFFCSDLHGRPDRYRKLMTAIGAERPVAVFLGGDLLPHHMDHAWRDQAAAGGFIGEYLAPACRELRSELGVAYPQVFVIFGNDDPQAFEAELLAGQEQGLWEYVHGRRAGWREYEICGYNCVPPTPFLLKDWERYDVSRYVDPGCVSPEEGRRTDGLTARDVRWSTIRDDLAALTAGADPARLICLFHSPPYRTHLDRAALDGRSVDHAPLDVHVGSIAIKEFIEARQPYLTLHGHIHEAARLTGVWRESLGRTHAFNAAHDGPELALVRFDPAAPALARRDLV